MTSFDQTSIVAFAGTPMAETSPFFIVGSSRSGTTLLRLIITGHSRIHIPPETWFILPLVERFSLHAVLSRADAGEVVRIITGHNRWPDLELDALELQQAANAVDGLRLVDLIDLVYFNLLKKAGKQRIGDKTPLYIRIVPQLAALYPKSKFIHLIRDGRDVAISFIDANFEERCYDGDRFEWIPAIRNGISYRTSPIAGRIMELKYDELVENPESKVRTICEFLGESFEPQMLDYRDRSNLVPAHGQRIHSKLSQPISDQGIGVWKRKLSALQCFAMEACLHNELTRVGYSLRFGSFAWRPILLVSAAILRALSPLLDRAIPYLQRRGFLTKPFYF